MAYLALDLDLTVFIGTIESAVSADIDMMDMLDPTHTLYDVPTKGTLADGTIKAKISLINPKELSAIIEAACTLHDGLIILTSGKWDRSILRLLAAHLELSDKAREMVYKAYFHSAFTDQTLYDLPASQIMHIPKRDRLKKIIAHHPKLKGKRIVTLDDSEEHTDSYKKMMTTTIPVLATPHLPDKSYYDETLSALELASRIEKRVIHPHNDYNGEIRVSFFGQKRKLDSTDENLPPAKKPRKE